MSCPRCNPQRREMDAERIQTLYERLKPSLRVVDSFGCHTPKRGGRGPGDHSAWPLHHWRGPGTFPLVVEFSGLPGRRPTFDEFCAVYNLVPVLHEHSV